MKYKVTYEYRARVTAEVEAQTEQGAIDNALAEADEKAQTEMHVYSARAKPVNDNYHNGSEDDYYVKVKARVES